MKFKNIKEVELFLSAINECEGNVYLKSVEGDVFNLKSDLSKYVAVAALVQDKAEKLELFCDKKSDEGILIKFLNDNPEVV